MKIKEIIERANQSTASDIHLCKDMNPVIRVAGNLVKLKDFDLITEKQIQNFLQELLTPIQREELDIKKQIDFSVSDENDFRFRVNIYKQKGNDSIAIRILPKKIPTLQELHLPDVIKEICFKKRGLFLVTGPAGSGKSTSLAAMIDYINENKNSHIITLEDPIEYLHGHKNSIVNQREIGKDVKGFKEALNASVKQDPDVIVISDMKDLDTISLALSAAETGHLVFASLPTIDVVSTIDRIISVFDSQKQPKIRVQLASVLLGIMSQQLVPSILDKKRVLATEIMICNSAIRNHIKESRTQHIYSSIKAGSKYGMMTMDECLKFLCNQELINCEVARDLCYDIEEF